MAWKDWPSHERNWKSDMNEVFFDKIYSRLKSLRNHAAGTPLHIENGDQDEWPSPSWTPVYPQPTPGGVGGFSRQYIWIPPYVKHLVGRWQIAYNLINGQTQATAWSRLRVGSHTGNESRCHLSDIGDPTESHGTYAENISIPKGSVCPNPFLGNAFGPSDWGTVKEVIVEVRAGQNVIWQTLHTGFNPWWWADENTVPMVNSEANLIAHEY